MNSIDEEFIRRIVNKVLRENEKANMERMLNAIGYTIAKLPHADEDQPESQATPAAEGETEGKGE
jgi:hypothetical protein